MKEFQQLRPEWNNLTEEPLQSFDWNFSWWDSLGRDSELRIYCLRDEQKKLTGIAPFFVDKWVRQTRLRFIGSGATCTDYAKVIVRPEFESEFARKIDSDVTDSSFALVELEGLAGASSNSALCSSLESGRYWRYDTELEPVWILSIPQKWEDFVSGAKKSLRRKINKATRRLAEGEVTVRTWPGEMEFENAFKILVELHQERFTSKGESGVFADVRFRAFLSSAIKALGEKQNAEILIAHSNGRPVGVQLYLIGRDGPQLYQSGVRGSELNLEPGHLLFTFAVKRAIQNRFPVFDFLRGNEPYKQYWGAVPNTMIKTRCVSNAILPTVLNKAYMKLRTMKNALKSKPDAPSSGSG